MFNLSVGVVITGVLIFGTDAILKAVGIARDLEEPAEIYLRIIGVFCICNTGMYLMSDYSVFKVQIAMIRRTLTPFIAGKKLISLFIYLQKKQPISYPVF